MRTHTLNTVWRSNVPQTVPAPPGFYKRGSWFNIVSPVSAVSNLEATSEITVEGTILQRIAAGDTNAVEECLDQYGGLVWSLARRMLSDRNEAEDAVQEIFIEIWKNAERFDESQASETTFVAMIARRRLIDRIRKVTRQPNLDSVEDMVGDPPGDLGENIQMSVEARQAAEVMKELRPEQKKILELSIVQGYSHQEISDALSMPLGTVKTHARRGLIQVREALAKRASSVRKEVSA